MTTCLVIGDPHFKTTNPAESHQMIDRICDVIRDRNPRFVVCLGDILHTHEKIHIEALCLANRFIFEIAKLAEFYLIIGNHDRPNNSDFLSDRHAFTGLKGQPNVHIIDTTYETMIDQQKFVFVPYVFPGRFMEALETIEEPLTHTTCIFAHQEFLGAKMGAIISEIGDPWPLSNPLVVSGHIHDFDELQSNLIYTGAPNQHGFGDNEDKTISLFTFHHSNPPPTSWDQERIGLGLTKRRTVRLKISDFTEVWEPPANCILRLVLYGTNSEIKTILKHPRVAELRSQGIKVDTKLSSETSLSPLKDPTPHQNFLTTLYQRIEDSSHLVNIYNQLFHHPN